MKVLIGFDHRGIDVAEHLASHLADAGCECLLVGSARGTVCDYPGIALEAGKRVVDGEADFGVLIDASGIGMAIAANKVKGVRAAMVHDEMTAQIARSHLDANVLCVSADLTSLATLERMLTLFMKTEFEGGRHARRIEKIAAIEAGEVPTSEAGQD